MCVHFEDIDAVSYLTFFAEFGGIDTVWHSVETDRSAPTHINARARSHVIVIDELRTSCVIIRFTDLFGRHRRPRHSQNDSGATRKFLDPE